MRHKPDDIACIAENCRNFREGRILKAARGFTSLHCIDRDDGTKLRENR